MPSTQVSGPEWVDDSVHNQRGQPQFRERLSPVGGSEHCRLLTKFAVGVMGPLTAYRADCGGANGQ